MGRGVLPVKSFFDLYDVLIDGVLSDAVVTATVSGACWTAVETASSFGMAMTTPVDTAPRMLDLGFDGMSLRQLAQGAKSWNLTEADIRLFAGFGG